MARSSLLFFCPACWAEVPAEARVCPRCRTDMEAIQQGRDFVDKLIAALDHPEAETRTRAALILGLRAEDAFMVEAAIESLARIGDARCREVLEAALDRGTLRVRRAARQALASLEKRNE